MSKRHQVYPLTDDQIAFCEDNHNLVLSFLHKRGYSVDEFYTVVILDYVRACQIYLERKDLQEKTPFPVVAHMNMKRAISNHFVNENRKCRKAEGKIISIEQLLYSDDGDSSVREIPSDEIDILDGIVRDEEDKNLMENIGVRLTNRQSEILQAVLEGYKEREIYKQLNIGRKTYKAEFEEIKNVILNCMSA